LLHTQPFARYGGSKFEQMSAFFWRLFKLILLQFSSIDVIPNKENSPKVIIG